MKNSAKSWLTFAHQDLKATEVLVEQNLYGVACFHAQQCIEKALITFYTEHMPPRIHSTAELIKYLPVNFFLKKSKIYSMILITIT